MAAVRVLRALESWEVADGLDADLFQDFARETIDRIRGPFLAQHPPREVLRYLETAFVFASRRPQGEIRVDLVKRPRGVYAISSMEDQPFIVDTVRLFLRRHEIDYWGGFNVIFRAKRDEDGTLVSVGGEEGVSESLALLEGDGGTLLERGLSESCAALHHALSLAQAAVRDFRAMTRTVERFLDRAELMAERRPDAADAYRETSAFLKWILRDNFVFLGMEHRGEPLGIQRLEGPFHGSPEGHWMSAHPPGMVQVRKAAQESPVHRSGRIDELKIVLDEGGDGEEVLFVRGTFAYRALSQPSRNVPILRHVLRGVLQAQKAKPGSFRYKGIANVFDSLPTEFLFTTPRPLISEMVDRVLDAEQKADVAVTIFLNGDDTAFCLVSMPKEQYSDDLRREVQEEVTSCVGATYADHGLFMGRFETVLLYYYLTGLSNTDADHLAQVEERVRARATPWVSRLWHTLAKTEGEERADYLVETYGHGFPEGWGRRTQVERAARDLEMLDALAGREILADVFERDGAIFLRVYQARDVFLTDILPVLDNFGLTVRRSEAVEVASRGGGLSFDTFELDLAPGHAQRFLANQDKLTDALPPVFCKRVANDPLNELVLSAGLDWRGVEVLRAYIHYLRQLQIIIGTPRVRTIMLTHPITCRKLFELFEARFDPDLEDDREAHVQAVDEELQDLLRLIRTHDEDLVLSGIHNLIHATLRTNHYREDREGDYLSFKLSCADVRDMGSPRPLYEIYVHSREVEGVHLRFGAVARGGLRWSDRADYRTEVLGLVTTQQVKNVVIVPEGSKGGFYLRHPALDGGARRRQADEQYQVFIRGLLDVTDNVVDGEVVPPPRVVRHDGDDPYLVVAADKGTAHLSDTANAISEDFGFWLGDAFASGGSNGYDHKGVGITARGAWVLVRRHFAELGLDPYAETFTATGVGDMGGDVFGNGMLETPHVKLLAAFNHLHVFLDPDPDPARSFEERKRLFAAGRKGGWGYYDPEVISEGGGVFERSAKSIPLSGPAQAMLGIEAPEASPEEVIRAILRMEVDLFWSGGIGTYVKASHETHDDADDRSNDRARVDADALRCRVVGEGANLSFTQAARIEAARNGVALNTDFIDNSAGVDMSDHEVNLKILLGDAVNAGSLDVDARNALLEELTDEVADLVLASNDAQGRQISRDRIRSADDIFPFGRAISFIERVFGYDRDDLFLPTDAVLKDRAAKGEGLTRPELSMLSSHVKRWVFSELMSSGRARELTGYGEMLHDYFPGRIREEYPELVDGHQLADEIAMTVATTRVVADAGAAFLPLATESTGRSVFELVDAYLRAESLARAAEVRSTLEELRTSVSLTALYKAWVTVDAGCRDVTRYWMAPGNRVPRDEELEVMREAAQQVYELQADTVAKRNAAQVEAFLDDDIPADVARRVLESQYLNIALMVWSHAKKLELGFRETVVRQLAVGRASRIQELIDQLGHTPTTGVWSPIAMEILATRFSRLLRELVIKLGDHGEAEAVDDLEPELAEGVLEPVRCQVDELMPEDAPLDIPALLVLEERLSGVIARLEV